MLNFGALIAFMGVNAAAFLRYYGARKRRKLGLPDPSGHSDLSFASLLWLNLSRPAMNRRLHLDGSPVSPSVSGRPTGSATRCRLKFLPKSSPATLSHCILSAERDEDWAREVYAMNKDGSKARAGHHARRGRGHRLFSRNRLHRFEQCSAGALHRVHHAHSALRKPPSGWAIAPTPWRGFFAASAARALA